MYAYKYDQWVYFFLLPSFVLRDEGNNKLLFINTHNELKKCLCPCAMQWSEQLRKEKWGIGEFQPTDLVTQKAIQN